MLEDVKNTMVEQDYDEDAAIVLDHPVPPEVDFDAMPISQWRRLSMAHRNCSEMLLKSTGLTDVSQPALLAVLAACPDYTAESQKLLAEKLHVTPATITVSLRSMQRNGYIEKEMDGDDQRRKRIRLTEKGRESSYILGGFTNMLDAEMYKGFSDEERALCADFFRRMTENLENSAQGIRKVIKKRERIAAAKAALAFQTEEE